MSESFFQVGDIVTVRRDLDLSTKYGSDGDTERTCNILCDMLRYAGRQFTIEYVYKNGYGRIRYHIGGQTYIWTDEMFEEYINRTIQCEAFEPASPADLMSILGMV